MGVDVKVLAIDPGSEQSAFVIWDGITILQKGILDNWELLAYLDFNDFDYEFRFQPNYWTMEYIKSSRGMPVGEDVFQTVLWTGIFVREIGYTLINDKKSWYCALIPRNEVKMHMCGSTRAKDSNVITAIVDRFDPMRKFGKYGRGTTKNPGPLFGVNKDIWQAFALGITFWDLYSGGHK